MAAIQDFDRRWIFLVMGVLVTTLYALGIAKELTRSEYVDSYYATIEALPEGSVVMLSADFDPASAAELLPAYTATIHHLLKRRLKVINVATWPAAPPYTRGEFNQIAPLYDAVYGEAWVSMGFLPGDDVAMGNIGQSMRSAFPEDDVTDTPYDELPILADVGDNMEGIDLLITMSAGYPGILEWIAQVGGRYDVPILAATTAVQTPDLFAFYPTQCVGFLGAATGATRYLQLVDELTEGAVEEPKLKNQKRMMVQSWAHMFMIALIVIGNVIYFMGRSRERRATA
jgi:hypothetical protein